MAERCFLVHKRMVAKQGNKKELSFYIDTQEVVIEIVLSIVICEFLFPIVTHVGSHGCYFYFQNTLLGW